ncbi:MAG: class I SAM-dependent methyltransferase [Pyrinomonadaceae bacterium]
MKTTLRSVDGTATIEEAKSNSYQVTVEPKDGYYSPITQVVTKYPLELIKQILQVKGACYLCDELAREEDEAYVNRDLGGDLTAYFIDDEFAGKRILDFGSGSGASTMVLSRMYPKAQIVGVELKEDLNGIAEARLAFYGYKNVEFHLSPSASELPENCGKFDLVILSAVYEHMLPNERSQILPLIWNQINQSGYLFINMTPHRYFPIEHHTTGLPGLNYLPDSLTYKVASRFSNRLDAEKSWEDYLRSGIRGGTEGEILGILRNNSTADANLLEPQAEGINDRIDLWYSYLNKDRKVWIKRGLKVALKSIKAITGKVLVPNLSLVIQKQ